MRVLVVDESAERAEMLRAALRRAGYELVEQSGELEPELIVFGVDSPCADVLEQLAALTGDRPRPVVMFSADGSPRAIREATRAGVCAYVVDGLDRKDIKAIVDAAVARFEEFQALRARLAEANRKLSERKLVERAKGLLMKSRGMDEETAYALLRKTAMDRNLRLGEVAQRVIEASDFLGA